MYCKLTPQRGVPAVAENEGRITRFLHVVVWLGSAKLVKAPGFTASASVDDVSVVCVARQLHDVGL